VKHAKIVRVASWDGWCGACAADRPLVLTRTGRQRLRTWLTGAADDSRSLLLTCRLCGTGEPVPLERDDPPVVLPDEVRGAAVSAPSVGHAEAAPSAEPTQPLAVVVADAPPPATPLAEPTDPAPGHRAVAQALGALLAQRTAAAAVPRLAPVPALAPVAAPLVPLQRTPSHGGLAELQLLADGIDLLSTGRT
jgi:hypothetical protein